MVSNFRFPTVEVLFNFPAVHPTYTTNANVTYNDPVTNNVGVGTTSSPISKLNVVSTGNLYAGNFTAPSSDALHTYSNGTGAGIVSSSLNGTGGQFIHSMERQDISIRRTEKD